LIMVAKSFRLMMTAKTDCEFRFWAGQHQRYYNMEYDLRQTAMLDNMARCNERILSQHA
jgi:hypothetical protein